MPTSTSTLAPLPASHEPQYTRLHISPLTPALLSSLLPPSLHTAARNISYHTLQTFPDRNFGFLELPAADAQRLRQKLNGSILKGVKLSVEPAREEGRMKRTREAAVEASAELEVPEKKTKAKKRKVDGELLGIQLEGGRSVKRGWETDKKSKRKDKAKGKSDKDEEKPSTKQEKGKMVFRTKVPANKASSVASSKKKQKRDQKDIVEVKEFDQSKPFMTFLRQEQTQHGTKAKEFIQGKGWVDEEGNVIEEVKRGKKPSLTEQQRHEKAKRTETPTPQPVPTAEDDPSSSEESSVVSSDSDSDSDLSAAPPAPLISVEAPKPAVHPLEALFKRPKDKDRDTPKSIPPPINTAFSFFGDAPDDDDPDAATAPDAAALAPPMTPFTQRDRADRVIRSAAPTPDTAAIGKRFSQMPWTSTASASDASSNDEAEAEGTDDDHARADAVGPALPPAEDADADAPTEFERHFWANRGDYNRAWKARKREARKERRQAENKRTGLGRARA